MSRSVVAVVKTKPETVLADIDRLCELARMRQALPTDRTTLIKENISWHYPFLSANTTPWQLEGAIQALQKRGHKDIVCAANETVVTNAFKGERLNRLSGVLAKYQIPTRYNFNSEHMNWVQYQPKAEMLVLNRIYKHDIRIPDFFFDKNIVHLPTMKCHIYTTITGSMKNAFGGLLCHKRHYTHSWIHETLVDLLAIQKEIHSGIFTITDGTVAGDGAGPRTMMPFVKDTMLASADSLAIDAVSAKMMGFDPMNIQFIRLAHERGLGTGRIEEIDVIGEDISAVNFHFRQTDNPISRVGKLFWYGPFRRLQHFTFHTPLVYLFVFGSFLYHDFIWWPTRGKARMRALADTSWMKLFKSYKE
jgi:uncharacterized protein (DUF362 family)